MFTDGYSVYKNTVNNNAFYNVFVNNILSAASCYYDFRFTS